MQTSRFPYLTGKRYHADQSGYYHGYCGPRRGTLCIKPGTVASLTCTGILISLIAIMIQRLFREYLVHWELHHNNSSQF